jgi:hypothetical protein
MSLVKGNQVSVLFKNGENIYVKDKKGATLRRMNINLVEKKIDVIPY